MKRGADELDCVRALGVEILYIAHVREFSVVEGDRDHIEIGMEMLHQQGYPRSEYVTASLGRGPDGDEQILIIGRSHIEIRNAEGRVLLDAGIREIRGVRLVAGTGLEIWVTTRPNGDDFGKRHWDHLLPDRDAQCLESLWLQSQPFVHTGVQLNRRPWREEEYAYYVGRVLTEAAQCEVRLASLLGTAEMLGFKLRRTPKGKSGKPLVELLEEVGVQSPAFQDLAERYSAWYEWRNFSAHGVRYDDKPGRPSSQVFKMKTKEDGTGEDFEVRDQDFQDLARLWSAFYSLGSDADRVALDLLRARGGLNEKLRTISMPNSASAEARLP